MPTLSQGDIFERLKEGSVEVAIVFGHIGYGEMAGRWRAFADTEVMFAHIQDPFSKMPKEPLRISSDQWLWFVPAQDNQGMAEGDLKAALNDAISWAREAGHTSIITNGIANTDHGIDTDANRYSDDQRAQFLILYSVAQENSFVIAIELVSWNDVFVRFIDRTLG